MKKTRLILALAGFLPALFILGFTGSDLVKNPPEKLNGFSQEIDSGQINGINYYFVSADTFYSFRGYFTCKSDPACLCDITFSPEHKVKYTKDLRSFKVTEEGGDWYRAEYRFTRYSVIRNTSDWLIKWDADSLKIGFRMISSASNIIDDDLIISSSGYYQFKEDEDGYIVEYFQECLLKPGFQSGLFISGAKADALRFISDYRDYLMKNCADDR